MKRTAAPAPHLRRAGLFVAIAGLAAIGFATLLPEPGAAVGSHLCLLCGSLGGVNSILNVLLFVPLGIGLALSGFTGTRAVVAMFVLSALIETAQLLVIPGRYSTVGDLITNSLGGALGFVIGRYAPDFLRPPPRIAMTLTVGWSALWLAIQATSAFGLSPLIPRSDYYGQIAPCIGNFEQFKGRVLRATIADVLVPDTGFEDSRRVRHLLMSGATVTLAILPPAPEPGIAPIVRIADSSQREILLVAQTGSDLVFGVRTGASALRLRPPLFAMADVIAAPPAGESGLTPDTTTVSARYSPREVWVRTRSRTSHDRRIPITASLAWTFLLPFQWFIMGTGVEVAVSVIWIACLVFPIGYWGAWIVRVRPIRAAARARIVGLPIALTLLYVGLVAAPREFGLPAASALEWIAAVTGLFAGVALAARASTPAAKADQTD
jgi:hypothetical protein